MLPFEKYILYIFFFSFLITKCLFLMRKEKIYLLIYIFKFERFYFKV